MSKRFVTIWFPYLKTDWYVRRQPRLQHGAFALAAPDHGRMVITALNALAQEQGVHFGMTVADARAMIPSLEVLEDQPALTVKLLSGLAEWCVRFSPAVAVDPPDGLILDVTGCTHLWGSEEQYITVISKRFQDINYHTRIAMADTIGAAWAIAHFTKNTEIVGRGQQMAALLPLPPAALRLEAATVERLEKLGLRQLSSFVNMPRAALRRRFGDGLLLRLHQALGMEEEHVQPVQPITPYQERLPCLEPIVNATGINIALERLLGALCKRLQEEEQGLREANLKCYRVDGKMEIIRIGTNRPSHNTRHIFKLFEFKLPGIEPALGIELFILEAPKVSSLTVAQSILWNSNRGLEEGGLAELLDRVEGKVGAGHIHRFLPDDHYWPERSFKPAISIDEKLESTWRAGRPRPLNLLSKPEPIEVTAPIPDYPPMLFRYKGVLHKVAKADGPERIESEWWIQEGLHRDYYRVEDESGSRYWLFRLGHYDVTKSYQWFMHGFFA